MCDRSCSSRRETAIRRNLQGRCPAGEGTQQPVVTPIEIHQPVRSVRVELHVGPRGTERKWVVRTTPLETESLVDLLHSGVAGNQRNKPWFRIAMADFQNAQQNAVTQRIRGLAVALGNQDSFWRVVKDDVTNCFFLLKNPKEPVMHKRKGEVVSPVEVVHGRSKTKTKRRPAGQKVVR